MRCGGGIVVSTLSFFFDDPSSNPAVFEKNGNKGKRDRSWPISYFLSGMAGSVGKCPRFIDLLELIIN